MNSAQNTTRFWVKASINLSDYAAPFLNTDKFNRTLCADKTANLKCRFQTRKPRNDKICRIFKT